MCILDKYIIKQLLISFILCMVVFLGLYIIIDLFSHLDDIIRQKASINLVLNYYLSFLPIIFVQTSPFAALLATIFALGNMSRGNEIIAIRCAGLSLWQITKSIILFAVVLSVFVFIINEKLAPRAQVTTEEIKGKMFASEGNGTQEEIINDLTVYGMDNRLIYISRFFTKQDTMQGITILEHDENQNLTAKIDASKGVWNKNYWVFYQCLIYNFDGSGQMTSAPLYFDEKVMSLPETPRQFLQQRHRPEHMNTFQLKDYIFRLSKSGAHAVIRNLKVDLYQKFALPVTSLVLILVGIPFSIKVKKRGLGISSIGICIAVSFLYYVVWSTSIAFGKSGLLPPFIAAWFANITFIFLSLYLISSIP